MKQILSLLATLIITSVATISFGNPTLPTAVGTIVVGGEGGWDLLAVDTASHRLYVSHATSVVVIDLDSQKVVHQITGMKGVHGIAVAHNLNRGFISAGGDSTVVVFDLKTDSVLAKVSDPYKKADVIIYDEFSSYVFVFNAGSNNAYAIDAKTLKGMGIVELPGAPEFAASNGHGLIYVNIEDKSTLATIDVKTMKVISDWPLAPGEEPSGLALDKEHHRLFSACHNKMMVVVNADNGKVITSLPIGQGVDGTVFDATNQLVYNSCREGITAVIAEENPNKFTAVGMLETVPSARTIAVDERTHRIYLPSRTPPKEKGGTPGEFTILVYQQ